MTFTAKTTLSQPSTQ